MRDGFTLLVCGYSGGLWGLGCVDLKLVGSGCGMVGVRVLHMFGRAARLGSGHLVTHQLGKEKKRKKKKSPSQVELVLKRVHVFLAATERSEGGSNKSR